MHIPPSLTRIIWNQSQSQYQNTYISFFTIHRKERKGWRSEDLPWCKFDGLGEMDLDLGGFVILEEDWAYGYDGIVFSVVVRGRAIGEREHGEIGMEEKAYGGMV